MAVLCSMPIGESPQAFDWVGRRCRIGRDSASEGLLVRTLELVVEHDTADGGALLAEPFGGVQVRTIDLRVVRQFRRLRRPP